jgi:dipeptidyl aminopeptidase/acylaminoacyl peptidase
VGSKKKTPFTPEDLMRIKFVSDPMVHPSGTRIAFVLRSVDQDLEENRYRSSIFITDREGKNTRRLTAEELDSDSPIWSPDGKQLLFLSKRKGDEKKQIYLLPADGGEAQRLTEVEGGVNMAVWSPDGKRIAFRSAVQQPELQKRVGEGKPFANDVQLIDTPLWQLNGVGSWLDQWQHLFVIPAKGGKATQLTEGAWNVGGALLGTGPFNFSADGERVYYLASPDPADDWSAARCVEIHSVDLKGNEQRRITGFGGMFSAVKPVPSGELLAIGNSLERSWASPMALWRIDPENGECRAVNPDFDFSLSDSINCDVRFNSRSHDPWVSADLERARTLVTKGDVVRLAEFMLEGGDHTWLTQTDFSVLGWHSSEDGSLRAEVRTSTTQPPELWRVDSDGDERRITRLNDRLLASRKVFPAKAIPVKASDGAVVEAWSLIPPGRKRAGRAAVLEIHGGPKTVYGNAFMFEFQMLAGAGMVVLYANPRGSDGYGAEWAEAVHGHYGERDYQDLMECVDHLLALDLGIDRKRLGVLGGSYGGWMTNWILGHTDRFKAAVSQRGISNWTSFFGTSDIGYFFNPEHVGALPWENPDLYLEKSPLSYAQEMTTPLLLIHSERDLRCPIEQAEQLFVYLKRLGQEVVFARFPEETHELSRSGLPTRRMERLRLILNWFNEKLEP